MTARIIICHDCGARSDDPDGHGPACRAYGGWTDYGPPPREAPQLDGEELARAALRGFARQALEQHGDLWSERHQRLLDEGIRLLRLFGDHK